MIADRDRLIGTREGQTAMSAAMSYRLAPNMTFSAGMGVGLDSGEIGARAGLQVAW